MIIGGAEDKKGECTILKHMVRLSGGNRAVITVITAATLHPTKTGKNYVDIFSKLGAKRINVVNIPERKKAFSKNIVRKIHSSTGIFFTGGDQLRITSLLGGTPTYKALYNMYEKGVIIAGTSAGASAMSDVMIVEGKSDESPKKSTVSMAPGLRFLEEVVVDSHFAQRGRIGRLMFVVAQNPYILGVGIDEDTALLVKPDDTFTVIGSQTVTVIDGKNISFTNTSQLSRGQPLSVFNAKIHILGPNTSFDLKKRRPKFVYDENKTVKMDNI